MASTAFWLGVYVTTIMTFLFVWALDRLTAGLFGAMLVSTYACFVLLAWNESRRRD